jgi:hypothetical protein
MIRRCAVARTLLALTIACPALAIGTSECWAKRSPEQKRAADSLAPQGIFGNVGWAMGLSGDPFREENDAPGSEKLDLAPFINVGVNFGQGSGWSADVMAVFANFGRLVNQVDVEQFSEQTSGTSVRRALITDFTVKAPLWATSTEKGVVGFGFNVLNTGFIIDAQGEADDQNPLDAATYLFSGASLYYAQDAASGTRATADLLLGISELMTGDEVFDFSDRAQPSLRVRPRLWVQFEDGFIAQHPLQIGFWADLGIEEEEADALTAYVAVPLRKTN